MKTKGKLKVLWALDAYGSVKAQAPAANLVRVLSRTCEIEIVYIYGTLTFLAEAGKELVRFNLASAEEKLIKTLNELQFRTRKPPKIIAHGSDSNRSNVITLMNYAKKIRADLIVVSTNAKSGIERLVMGSFAETLILSSTIPLIVVNPKAKIQNKVGEIIFATDFSESSWQAFKQAAYLAKAIRAPILLFHQYQGEAQFVPANVQYFRRRRWLDKDELLDDRLKKIKKSEHDWINWCNKKNIKCSSLIDFGLKNVSDATVALSKKRKTWMIAMASKAGPIAANFLGSNARWTARVAEVPVWVLRVPR